MMKKKHFNYKAFIIKNLVRLSAIITFAILAFIVGYILVKGIPYLTPSLFELEYNSTNVSLMPALISTIAMTLLALLISVPIGIATAIYLVEYAK
ncbi:MAG: phosphate ABC transporter, permease protein PstA, partial [Clostridiaceae bacterium]